MLTYIWHIVWNELINYFLHFSVLISHMVIIDWYNPQKSIWGPQFCKEWQDSEPQKLENHWPRSIWQLYFPLEGSSLSFLAQQPSIHLFQTHHHLGLGCRLSPLQTHYLPCPKALLLNCLCFVHDMGPGGSQLFILPGKAESGFPQPASSQSGRIHMHKRTATSAWTVTPQTPAMGLGRQMPIYGLKVGGSCSQTPGESGP